MLAFVKLFNGTVVSTTANQVNLNISELAKAKLLVNSAIQAATATAGQTQVFSANDIKQAFPGQKIELIESNGKETKKIQFILSDELATFTAQLMNKSIEHSRE
jgi:DNA-binding ferritin-like protein (Dps family)